MAGPYYVNNLIDGETMGSDTLEAIETGFQNVDIDKANKVSAAVAGNVASLDANGDLVDAGIVAASLYVSPQTKTAFQLNATDDLDLISEPGVYAWNDLNVPSNAPLNNAIMLIDNDGASDTQMVFGGESTESAIYVRRKDNGTWYAWKRMLDHTDVSSTSTNGATTTPISSDWAYKIESEAMTFGGAKTFSSPATFSALATFNGGLTTTVSGSTSLADGIEINAAGAYGIKIAAHDYATESDIAIGSRAAIASDIAIHYATGSEGHHWWTGKAVGAESTGVAGATERMVLDASGNLQIDGDLSQSGGLVLDVSDYTNVSGGARKVVPSTTIANGTDFDDVMWSGIYRTSSSHANMPGGGYGQLFVMRGGTADTWAQMYFDYGSSVWFRSRNGVAIGGSTYTGTLGWNKILSHVDVDDTPVSGATTAPVSSNWAYGHTATADPHSQYPLETDVNAWITRGYYTAYSASSLPVGWYTIAAHSSSRALAKFMIRDTSSGNHQATVLYASTHYGSNPGISVMHNAYYAGNPARYVRIKDGGTYDGAVLQVYIDETSNAMLVAMAENFQSSGWVLRPWIADATNPGTVANYAALVETARVDLDRNRGAIQTTGEMYSGGSTTQYLVLNTADVDNTPVNGATTAPISSDWAYAVNYENKSFSGLKTFSNGISSPTVTSSNPKIYSTVSFGSGLAFAASVIYPTNNAGAYNNGDNDLGTTLNRFRNFYAESFNTTATSYTASVFPRTDSMYTCGGFYNRWSVVYTDSLVNASGRELKTDIAPMPSMLDKVIALNPVTYRYKKDDDGVERHGLIAEEVEDVFGKNEKIVRHDIPSQEDIDNGAEDMEHLSINYIELISPLIRSVQELAEKVERLESALNQQ